MAAAAPAVTILRNGAAAATDMIPFPLEIIGMAGRAIRLVGREIPRHGGADDAAMTGRAGRRILPVPAATVVNREIAIGIVHEHVRHPGIGRVAVVTLGRGVQVPDRFAGRGRVVMTGITGTGAARIMRP